MINHDQLPSITNAKLPGAYTVAKRALAECEKIDECKDWADKAAALASYARQSKDESLFKAAARIQARAIRRCGELLKEFEPAKNQHDARACLQSSSDAAFRKSRIEEWRGSMVSLQTRPSTAAGTSRKQAAEEAGLSKRQKDTALRVANVPSEEFEAQVESDSPPTVTALAVQGTQKKPAPVP